MGKSFVLLCVVGALVCNEASSFMIRNKLLGKCLQAQVGRLHGRVSTMDCSPNTPLQEWHWHAGSQALVNGHTGQCLTAPAEQYQGVHLQPCVEAAEGEDAEEDEAAMKNQHRNQAWSCSRRGHLTLQGKSVHLIATKDSALVFLSKEHKQHGNRWLTLDNQTVCSERGDSHDHTQSQGDPSHLAVFPTAVSRIHTQPQQIGDVMGLDDYQKVSEPAPLSISTKPPVDPTMVFFTMDYGMSWKVTMLVLSSLALVLGTVILILNVYSNRRKKVVCVLKSYAPREEVSVPGSPVPSERAPLTRHAMHHPQSSPSLRGEILIEWKDGSVTPLYEG